jgi:hypothetical protein
MPDKLPSAEEWLNDNLGRDRAFEEAISSLDSAFDTIRADGIAQGRREAAELVREKRLPGKDGLQMFKSNFNSGIDAAIEAILGTASAEKTDNPATFPPHDNDGQTA